MSFLRTSLGLLTASLLVSGAANAQFVEDFEGGNPDNWQIDWNGTFNGFAITPIVGNVVAAGNPGNALEYFGLQSQTGGPFFLNSQTSADFSGNLRSKGVDGFSIDMNYTGNSPFGRHLYVLVGDDMGTPEMTDDVLCWSVTDFAQYSFAGFGAALPQGVWNTVSWTCDTSSSTLPAGWTVNTINNTFAGDANLAWDAIIQDVDYVAFVDGAPWGGVPLGPMDVLWDNITMTTGAVGTPYCFCDGSGSAAPCANTGAADAGCANGSFASGASISAVGQASVGASTLVLSTAGSSPTQPGLYFQGDVANNGGLGVLFGDGLRCAGGTVVRLETVFADGNGDSSTSIDIAVKGGVSAGQTSYYQYWYRDPAGSPCGSFFNTSNGLEIVWGM